MREKTNSKRSIGVEQINKKKSEIYKLVRKIVDQEMNGDVFGCSMQKKAYSRTLSRS